MEWLYGQTLMQFDCIRQVDLEAGLQLSRETGLPLGKSLVALNFITEHVLRVGAHVQSMMRDGLLSVEDGRRVMTYCRQRQVGVPQALTQMGLISLTGSRVRLGQLLVDSGCLARAELPGLLEVSNLTGLPLGMVMLHAGLVDTRTLNTVVSYQKLSRCKGAVDVSLLQQKLGKVIPPCQREKDFRLGQLFVAANILSPTQLQCALEMARCNNKPLGLLLIELNWLHPDAVDTAVKLQTLLRANLTEWETAAAILQDVRLHKTSLGEAAGKFAAPFASTLTFDEFLRITGCPESDPFMIAAHEQQQAKIETSQEAVGRAASSVSMSVKKPDVPQSPQAKAQETVMHLWQSTRRGLMPLPKAIVLWGRCTVQNKIRQAA